MHPALQLEFARQRQGDLLAAAERHRIAKALHRRTSIAIPFRRDAARNLDVEVGLELCTDVNRASTALSGAGGID